MLKHIASVLALLIVLASCSDKAVDPGTITVIQAKAGSTFTFDEYNTDTATGMPIAESRDTSVHTITRTGITFLGKSNVSEVSMLSSTDTSTVYFNYEANGDISFGYPGFSPASAIWVTYPISSKTSSTVTLIDTSYTFFGVTISAKTTLTSSYVGTESMTINGQSVSVIKIKMTSLTKTTTAGIPREDTSVTYIYIAPSLGYLAKVDQAPMTIPVLGTKSEGSYSALIRYTLK